MISWLNSHMALKDRIQEIVDAGFKRSALARAAKKTPSAVTQWLSGETQEIKSDSAAGIQALTGFNAVWIATGRLPKKVIAQQTHAANDGQSELGAAEPLVVKIEMGKPGVSMAGLELAKEFDRIPTGDESAWMQAYQHILQTIVLLQSNPKAKPLLAQSPETQRAAPPAPPL